MKPYKEKSVVTRVEPSVRERQEQSLIVPTALRASAGVDQELLWT